MMFSPPLCFLYLYHFQPDLTKARLQHSLEIIARYQILVDFHITAIVLILDDSSEHGSQIWSDTGIPIC